MTIKNVIYCVVLYALMTAFDLTGLATNALSRDELKGVDWPLIEKNAPIVPI